LAAVVAQITVVLALTVLRLNNQSMMQDVAAAAVGIRSESVG
jgi:hypothetical protein